MNRKSPRPHNPIEKSMKEKQFKRIGGMLRILEMSSISLSTNTKLDSEEPSSKQEENCDIPATH